MWAAGLYAAHGLFRLTSAALGVRSRQCGSRLLAVRLSFAHVMSWARPDVRPCAHAGRPSAVRAAMKPLELLVLMMRSPISPNLIIPMCGNETAERERVTSPICVRNRRYALLSHCD